MRIGLTPSIPPSAAIHHRAERIVAHAERLSIIDVGEEMRIIFFSRPHRILLDTRIRFHYVTRSSWAAAYRQYRGYGRARVHVIALHPGFLRARHLAPPALVAGLAATALAMPVAPRARRGLPVLLGAYALGAIVAGARVSARAGGRAAGTGRASAARVGAAFLALHLGYGVGVLRGLAELTWRVTGQVGNGGEEA